MELETFFDPATYTLTYVVFDPESRDAVVIDPVLDYEPAGLADQHGLRRRGLALHRARGPHPATTCSRPTPTPTTSRARSSEAAARRPGGHRRAHHRGAGDLPGVFDLGPEFRRRRVAVRPAARDGETLQAGTLAVRVIATPGHTPACVSYLIDDAVFTGDALFIEDYGTGRCDFPRGQRGRPLPTRCRRLYALPDATRVFVGHDYQPGGARCASRPPSAPPSGATCSSAADTPQEEFVAFRKARDATLAAPRLLLPSVQVNVNAGRLPRPHDNGMRYLQPTTRVRT
jgi:glyoxylase-like metal-dependent hydrolase (beta-lactamase superfamily II)